MKVEGRHCIGFMAALPLSLLAGLDWLLLGLRIGVALVGLLLVAGTLASMTRLTPWFVRGWDFPRVQMAVLALACGAAGVSLAAVQGGVAWYDWTFLVLMIALAAWQASRIRPYTPLASREVQPAASRLGSPNVLRLVISNVLESNCQFDRWRQAVAIEDPDIIIAAEVNDQWRREISAGFAKSHPHAITQPQDNCYGMALFSRLPLRDPRIEFVVQADIPSIHCTLTLRDGTEVCLHSLHPRPPTPQEQNSSGPRDVELIIVGKRIRKQREDGHTEPTIVVGDLNDVAWSRTTKLFQKLSGLLDPRRGRGFYNTFNANSRIFRFPLDHVFISREFRLVDLRVLDHVGSDHFPISITIAFEPEKQQDQPEPQADGGDQQEAHERLRDQARE